MILFSNIHREFLAGEPKGQEDSKEDNRRRLGLVAPKSPDIDPQ